MKSFNLFRAVRTLMLVISLGIGASALTALAQNTAPAQGGGTTTSSQTTTTKTTNTEEVARVNPIWWVLGGLALLLILLIAILAGRGRDRVDVVRERSTVVKKE